MVSDELLYATGAIVILLGIAKAFLSGFEVGRQEGRNERGAGRMDQSRIANRTPRLPMRGVNQFGELE